MPSHALLEALTGYVEQNIGEFHITRLASLNRLELDKVLGRKNAYLFRAKHLELAADLVKALVDAFLSSQEETLFGDFLEGLAIFANKKVYGGRKSGIEGIDLEFDLDGVRQIVTIKSGPYWGNAGQIQKMRESFRKAIRTLRTSRSRLQIQAVNGCCYGRDNRERGDYKKLCGQKFWSYLTGDEMLYLKLVHPLGHKAKERNEEFQSHYAQRLNLFTKDFMEHYCTEQGLVHWEKLIALGSRERS